MYIVGCTTELVGYAVGSCCGVPSQLAGYAVQLRSTLSTPHLKLQHYQLYYLIGESIPQFVDVPGPLPAGAFNARSAIHRWMDRAPSFVGVTAAGMERTGVALQQGE